jgi:hypothetical protein
MGQLKTYHRIGSDNINAFSMAIDGTKIAFFIYIDNIHEKYVNKS